MLEQEMVNRRYSTLNSKDGGGDYEVGCSDRTCVMKEKECLCRILVEQVGGRRVVELL